VRKSWLVEGSFAEVVAWLGGLERGEPRRLVSIPTVALRRSGARGVVRCDVTAELVRRPEGRATLVPAEASP
jgi:hypothetical protein